MKNVDNPLYTCSIQFPYIERSSGTDIQHTLAGLYFRIYTFNLIKCPCVRHPITKVLATALVTWLCCIDQHPHKVKILLYLNTQKRKDTVLVLFYGQYVFRSIHALC